MREKQRTPVSGDLPGMEPAGKSLTVLQNEEKNIEELADGKSKRG